jgi:hypothetical protein
MLVDVSQCLVTVLVLLVMQGRTRKEPLTSTTSWMATPSRSERGENRYDQLKGMYKYVVQ